MNKKPVVYIIDDESFILEILKKVIEDEYETKCFTNKEDLLKEKNNFHDVCLFVIDIMIDKINGIDLSNELFEMGVEQPRLFISGKYGEDAFKELTSKINDNYIFDFVNKPVTQGNFKNKINLLTQIYNYNKVLIYEKERSVGTIWDMLNHALIFIVLLDKDLNVRLANYSLAKELGFNSEKEIIGTNWLEFIEPVMHDILREVQANMLSGRNDYREFTNSIVSKNKELIKVKWFNTYANNNSHLCVSIGVPYKDISANESVDSVRSYFRDIVDRDKTMIQAIKQTMFNNSIKEQIILNKE